MASRLDHRCGIAAAMLMAVAPAATFAQTSAAPAGAAPRDSVLPEVRVKAERDREPPTQTEYHTPVTGVGRVQQELRDIPQSVTVVPQSVLRDRNADSLREALRSVAGITFNAGEGGRIGDNITIRGYTVVGDLYLDGLRDAAQYNREIFNLESIDVLRGPSSMLFGRGSTGGVVNQVSKRPYLFDRNDAQLILGSHDYRRFTADLNKKLGDTTAVRVNLMKTDADSSRDVVHQSRWGVAPSISWGIGTRNEFTLAHYHLQENNVPDFGVPFFQGRPVPVPTSRFYGLATDRQRSRVDITTATYIHRFDDTSQVRTVLRHADYDRDLWGVAPRLAAGTSVLTDATVINRQRQARGGIERVTTSVTDYTKRVTWGGMEHLLLAGVELVGEEATRWTNTSAVPNPAATLGAPNAFVAMPPAYFLTMQRAAFNSYRGNTVGLYAQDMVSLTPHWKFLAGARWDRFSADYDRPAPAGPLSRTDRVTSWRTGLIYQPDLISSYYISTGTAFNPSAELYQLDERTANTPPERSRNYEIGAKWDLRDGNLSVRTALFRTQKFNERNTDLAIPDVAVLSGKRHTDGLELEIAGRPSAEWQVFGGFSVMSAEVDQASGQQAAAQGKRPINTPRWTASLWSVYNFAPSWRVGGGVEAVSERYGDAANNNEVPGYVRFDTMLSYVQPAYELRVNVLNLTNRRTYEGVYAGHVVPGLARTVQLAARFKF